MLKLDFELELDLIFDLIFVCFYLGSDFDFVFLCTYNDHVWF